MTTNARENHLSREELLLGVVDGNDLSADRRAHLEQCRSCARSLAALQKELAGLSRQARELAPAPPRPFRLPDHSPSAPSRRWIPRWVFGAAAGLLLAVAVWGPSWWAWQSSPRVAAVDAVDEGRLLDDVDALVANALPAAIQDLASLAGYIPVFNLDVDGDLLDWVVPSIEDEDDDLFT